MTAIAYRARALGPLGAVDWAIPSGLSVVVGSNRKNKSTLLRVPELIRYAIVVGIHEAFKAVFQGIPHLRNLRVPPSTPMMLGLAGGAVEWEIELTVRGGQLAGLPREHLILDGRKSLWREPGSMEIESEGYRFSSRELVPGLALASVSGTAMTIEEGVLSGQLDLDAPDTVLELRKHLPSDAPDEVPSALATALGLASDALSVLSFRTYHYEINHLLRFGSAYSSASELLPTGENVFPLLRNWRDKPEHEERYEFVLSTMREIFPHLGRVGFEQAGQISTMEVSDRRWPGDARIPIARESTGFITALLQLCGLASCPRGGLVTFDEIETSLHPRAIKLLVEACRRRAASHDLRVVLATQSQTVLDQFHDDPSHVFVLEPDQETSPQALTELFSPEYLGQFSLGDLFAHLEFGGDAPPAP
ncbi:MAG: ATP-binding protein [Myxococcales bacterium]|nr:ATP-binding protein [Myxococcales bacterium]